MVSRRFVYSHGCLLALISCAKAFAPPATKASSSRQLSNELQLTNNKQSSTYPSFSSNHNKFTTALSSWPGKGDKNESEGKREADSRLNLSGEASEATLFFGVSSNSVEEFVAPLSSVLDDQTGGWALSYANLEPEDETTPVGLTFLATNIAYGVTGSLLLSNGNVILGVLTELACVASFFYHYSQLKFGQEGSRIVRLTLLVDYFFALSAILVGSVQLILAHQLPAEALCSGTLAVATLGACWVWEEGLTYIVFHSLWHLFSAYTGYIIGNTH